MMNWLYRLAYPAFTVKTGAGEFTVIPRGYRLGRKSLVEPTLRTRVARWLLRQIEG